MYSLQALEERDIPAINAVIRAAVHGWPLPSRVCRLSLPLLQYDAVDLEHYSFMGCFLKQAAAESPVLVGVVAWDSRCVHGLYVAPAAQGQGVGRALLAAVARTLPRESAPLQVKAQRVSATFFEQVGLQMSCELSSYPYTYLLPAEFAPPSPHSDAA